MTARTIVARRSRSDWPLKAVTYAAMAGISSFMIFPFVWMLLSSFKPFAEIFIRGIQST